MPEVLIVDPCERRVPTVVWGTDAEPARGDEEALDWLTLTRLLGWRGRVVGRSVSPSRGRGTLVACVTERPEALSDDWTAMLVRRVGEERALVLAGAAPTGTRWAVAAGVATADVGPGEVTGTALAWHGPGPAVTWNLPCTLSARRLQLEPDAEVWATLDGTPVVAARRSAGGGVLATTGLHPSRARAEAGAASALFKRVLTHGIPGPTAWLDLEGAVVLRMDDPGASANVHLESWAYAKLGEAAWKAIGKGLKLRGARMTVAYTPGWVDDGDAERGLLTVAGSDAPRHPGSIHPSPLVVHVDRTGHAPGRVNDYVAEHRGVEALRALGVVGVELHGHIHLHPDVERWSQAHDRYDDVAWYREFTADAEDALAALDKDEHPLRRGHALMREHFHEAPTTLVCPGQAWTTRTLREALDLDLQLVSAEGLALRDDDRFCWCAGVPATYVDKPVPEHLAGELPVIAYFHDYEPALVGPEWVCFQLDRWRIIGARRLIDFRDLAAALALRLHVEATETHGWRVVVEREAGPRLPRPTPVLISVPDDEAPSSVELVLDGSRRTLRVQRLGGALGRIVLPAG